MISSNSYHPALNLKHSGDLDNREKRGGKELRLGKECEVERTTKKVTCPLKLPRGKHLSNAGVPTTVLDGSLLKREELGCQSWALRSYLEPTEEVLGSMFYMMKEAIFNSSSKKEVTLHN